MCEIKPIFSKNISDDMTSVRIEELKLRITRSKTNVKSNIEEEFRKKGFEFTTCNTNEAKNEEVFKEQNDKDEPIVPYLCEIIDKSDKTIDDAPTPFQCTKCTKKFTRVQLLKQHQMVHSDEKPFACNECPKRFKKASHLKTHKLTHALDESPHKCTQCDKIFTQDASLKLHMQKHRGIRPFLCKYCGKSFPKLYTLQRHERTHDDERTVKMKEVRIRKNREKYGPPDIVDVDKLDDNSNKTDTDKNENINCVTESQEYKEIVNELSANLQNINKEQNEKSDIAPYLCEIIAANEQDSNKQFQCTKCYKRFSRLTYLKQHQMTHSDYKPFPCTECPMRFKKASHLKTHLLTHSEDSPYKCTQCGKKFTQDASLKCHLLVHSGIKPYTCKDCGKKFTKLYTLQRHEQTHCEVRPFQCVLCYKKFSDISNLKRHEMTHSDNKPYNCLICTKSFSLLCQLKRHEVTHQVKNKNVENNNNDIKNEECEVMS